jgi:diguanylate cyclase (GGDEF)-like protein
VKWLSRDLKVLAPILAALCVLAGIAYLQVQSMAQLKSALAEHDRVQDVGTELLSARRALLESGDYIYRTASPHLHALGDLLKTDSDAQSHLDALAQAAITLPETVAHLDALQAANVAAGLRSAEVLVSIQERLRQQSWVMLGLGGLAMLYACIVLLRAVRAYARLDERLRYESTHDGLSGLPNRRFFSHWAERAIAQAKRDRTQLALLYIDLDGFRQVNDEQGREIGDRLLRVAAKRFRKRVRESDVLARVGSDEYVILTPLEQLDSATVTPLAKRLIASLSTPLLPQFGDRYPIGASIGIAVYPANGLDPDALLHAAEVAMREAKAAGGNQFCFATGKAPAPATEQSTA